MNAVVAVYADWGIGAGGTQPLALKADRKRFRELTEGGAVIVGRRTMADFPGGRPLKNRVNLVLTRAAGEIGGATVVHSPAQAAAEAAKYERVYVIGGAQVYRAMLPRVERVYVTKLDACPVSDVFFPNLDEDPGWKIVSEEAEREENGVRFRFCVYERI